MKKLVIILISLTALFVLSSCCSTTFIDEDKAHTFIPAKENKSTIELIDGTLYSEGETENGDFFFCSYTKSQRKYDLLEFGLNNKSKKAGTCEPQIEFYIGNREEDNWTLVGRWDSKSSKEMDSDSYPVIYVKPNKKNIVGESGKVQKANDMISGRIYIKKYYQDYKLTYTTKYGETITSYFDIMK